MYFSLYFFRSKYADVRCAEFVALNEEYEIKIKTRQANPGTDLSNLEALFESGKQ
jgi:hypothetical protein